MLVKMYVVHLLSQNVNACVKATIFAYDVRRIAADCSR